MKHIHMNEGAGYAVEGVGLAAHAIDGYGLGIAGA